jgi:hypothetical protein
MPFGELQFQGQFSQMMPNGFAGQWLKTVLLTCRGHEPEASATANHAIPSLTLRVGVRKPFATASVAVRQRFIGFLLPGCPNYFLALRCGNAMSSAARASSYHDDRIPLAVRVQLT